MSDLFKRLLLRDREASRELVRRLRSTNAEDGIAIDDFERLIRLVAICLSRRVESDRELRLRHRGGEVLVDHLARRTTERLLTALGTYDSDRCDLGTWIMVHARVIMRQILAAAMAEASG